MVPYLPFSFFYLWHPSFYISVQIRIFVRVCNEIMGHWIWKGVKTRFQSCFHRIALQSEVKLVYVVCNLHAMYLCTLKRCLREKWKRITLSTGKLCIWVCVWIRNSLRNGVCQKMSFRELEKSFEFSYNNFNLQQNSYRKLFFLSIIFPLKLCFKNNLMACLIEQKIYCAAINRTMVSL